MRYKDKPCRRQSSRVHWLMYAAGPGWKDMYWVDGAYSQALCANGGSSVARVALAAKAGALAGSTVAYMESNTKVSKSSRTISIVEGWRNGARCRGEFQESVVCIAEATGKTAGRVG